MTGDSVTWKIAMWGTNRDRRLLEGLKGRFKSDRFDSTSVLGVGQPHQGLELRVASDSNEELEHHPELIGEKKLDFSKLKGLGKLFVFPESAIGIIGEEECYVRKGRAILPIAVSTPPHVIVDAFSSTVRFRF